MPMTRKFIAAAATLLAFGATDVLAQDNGRGGNEGGGQNPNAAGIPGAGPNRITRDAGETCYRPGETVTIDWFGLASFNGSLAVVSDRMSSEIPVVSYTNKAVLVSLDPEGRLDAGETYALVWTDSDAVQAKIAELKTCATERK